jgi:predicted Zn-dependent protease
MLKIIFLVVLLLFKPAPSYSTEIPEGRLITDDEIEGALTSWLQEIFTVAGISLKPQVFLLVDPSVNAGATFGGQIIVFTGLILKCKDVTELLGVLAHESGHIAGAHSARQGAAESEALIPALVSTLVGGAAALATGNSAPLAAGAAGGMHAYERMLLRYSRSQEETADSAALKYMEILGWPTSGLASFLNSLNNSYNGQIDPYTSTHPLSEDRCAKVLLYQQSQSKDSAPKKSMEPYETKFKRIKAKIKGFMEQPQKVLRDLPASDTSIASRYGRAIALYRLGKVSEALALIDGLLKDIPNDPHFLELKGQIYFETGMVKDAVVCYRASVKQRPHAPTLNILLAHSLIEASPLRNPEELEEAIRALKLTLDKDPENVFAWRLLAGAYGKNGQTDFSAGALAEEAWIKGDVSMAKAQAKKAINCSNLSVAKRAQDILNQTDPKPAKK